MKSFICILSLWVSLIWASGAYAQSTVIYQDDFEGTLVPGWSDDDTDFAPAVTTFLGRFADGQNSTSRTFNLPSNTEDLTIEFDLYRFDSWDNFAQFGFDRFEIDINGTEIFSLPFPNPQAARSGTSGNVNWSHTPLTGTQELGFVTGQFWFDQLHRFVLTIDNPGTSVTLTLRAALSQDENDESAGFDNFLVTAQTTGNAILANVETFAPIAGDSGGTTPSVLSSDTLNGNSVSFNDVTITSTSSSSPNVTLNTATGLITVAPNTSAGIFTVDYEICENADLTNCSSITEIVTVFIPGASTCPIGTVDTPGTFHVVQVTPINGSPNNPNGALGAPLAEGSQDDNSQVSGVTFFQSLIYDLTGDPEILVPEGTTIQVSLGNHFNSNPTGNILSSLDGNNYTPIGSSVGPWVNNQFRYDSYDVPAGGLRFLQIEYGGGGGLRFDGVIYDTQCLPGGAAPEPTTLEGSKTVEIFDPAGTGLHALPGNDVVYTITIENTGSGEVDAGSLLLIDSMPAQVDFFNGDIDDAGPELNPVAFQDTGGTLSFDFNNDAGFSDAAAKPTSFAECDYSPAAGYDPNVTFICFNPKGVMSGQSTLSVSFRARIQ